MKGDKKEMFLVFRQIIDLDKAQMGTTGRIKSLDEDDLTMVKNRICLT